MRQDQRDDGILTAVAGSSRFGKTWWLLHQIMGAQRVFVRDPRHEYVGPLKGEDISSIAQLAAAVQDIKQGPGVLCYTGPDSGFDDWAKIAYLWGQMWPAVVVGEEIADVTSPGKAPDHWGQLIRKGLFYGNHIYAVTQRPAESDKTVWGNASVIHCHCQVLEIDQKYMGRVLGVDPERVGRLEKYQWIERHTGDKNLYFGGPGL